MTFSPNSDVRILSGCKLKPDYQHSIWWISETNQYNYFKGLTKHLVTNVQYLRSGEQAIKVGLPIEVLMDCNYLIFTNVGHEGKHYYAFITNIKYISETTTLIEYEIDLIQTWYFECTLMPCLVEREHSATDNIGDNLLPESVPLGDYITYDSGVLDERLYENRIVVASTFNVDGKNDIDSRGGEMYGNTYSGLFLRGFPCTEEGIESLHAMISLDSIVPATDIVSIFMAPKFCTDQSAGIAKVAKCYEPFGSHTPRNKKLYTYPYNYLQITAGPTSVKEFKYELFNTNDAQFYIRGDLSCEPGVYLRPNDYKCAGEPALAKDITESMMLTGFPQCPWCSDMFLAFLAQVASTAVSVAKDVGLATGLNLTPRYFIRSGRVKYEKSRYDRAIDFAGGLMEHAKPEQSVQGANSNSTMFNVGEFTYKYARKRITEQYARMIDMHFDMYGYATNKVKVPDRTSRPQWNYVKTSNCCIDASIPSDIVTKIQDIYDHGITFWRWPNNVGDYSLDNSVK